MLIHGGNVYVMWEIKTIVWCVLLESNRKYNESAQDVLSYTEPEVYNAVFHPWFAWGYL